MSVSFRSGAVDCDRPCEALMQFYV